MFVRLDRMRPSLHQVRHTLCVSRRHKAFDRRGGGRRRTVRLFTYRNHRRRTAAPGRCVSVDGGVSEPRPHRDARDRRSPIDRPRAQAGDQDCRCEMPRERGGRKKLLGEPCGPVTARRSEVRHPGSTGLRVRARRRSKAVRSSPRAPAPCSSRRSPACSRPSHSPSGCWRTVCRRVFRSSSTKSSGSPILEGSDAAGDCAPQRRPRFLHGRGHRKIRGLFNSRPHGDLRPAARGGSRRRASRREGARRHESSRARA